MLKVFHYQETQQGSTEFLKTRLNANISLTYGSEIPEHADYEVLIAAFPHKELVEASPKLKALIIPFAGPPMATQELMRQYPEVAVFNTPYNSIATAETALALMLASAKFTIKADADLRQGDWSLRYGEQPQLMLHGKTVVILGYGRIGRHAAAVCHALGMKVLGVRRNLTAEDKHDPIARVADFGELKTALAQAEVLLIALPETPETQNLITETELELLPQGAILVNVGRGSIVNEKALYNALKGGKLAAAGLDVWYSYPKDLEARTSTQPSSYPFHELSNVVMSPHKAGWLGKDDDSRMVFLAQILNMYASGETIPYKVDLELGY
ncbi:MAG: hypothetical protein KC422_06515 [Trueperaceae bacterium]|nr:hypothetical protein [Trueperaceae bacterium]